MGELSKRLKDAEKLLKEKQINDSLELYKGLFNCINAATDLSHDELLCYYINYGELCVHIGDVKAAKEIFDRGKKRSSEEITLKDAELLNNSGFVDKHLGYFESAEKNYLKAKSVYENLEEYSNPFYIHTLNNLAILMKEKGDYSESERLFDNALYICQTNKNIPSQFKMQLENNLADCYFLSGRYEEAEPLYFSSMNDRVKKFGFKSPPYVECLNNLARLYSRQDKKTSEKIYRTTLSLLNNLLQPDDIRILKTKKNLAELYLSMGYFKDAEPLFEETSEKMKDLRGESYTIYRRVLLQLAETKWKLEKFKSAEELLEECYHYFFARQDIFKQEYIETLILYSQFLFDIHEEKKALKLVETALVEENKMIWHIIKGLSEDAALKYIRGTAEHTGYFLSVLLRFQEDRNLLKYFYPLIYARKSLVFEISFQHRLEKVIQHDVSLKDKYKTWRESRNELARRLFTGVGENEDKDEFKKKQLKLLQLCNSLEKDLIHSLTDDETAKNNSKTLFSLKTNEFVLDFYKYIPYDFQNKHSTDDMWYCRFKSALTADQITVDVQKIETADTVDALIKEYRQKICGDNIAKGATRTRLSNINEKIAICKTLYDLLVLDMEDCLSKGETTLPHCYLSPDGEISNISFESLIGSNDDFFIDCFSMSYCNSPRELNDFPRKRTLKDAVIFANPAFDLEKEMNPQKDKKTFYRKDSGLINLLRKKVTDLEFYGKLSGTAEEGKIIRKLLKEHHITVKYYEEESAYEKKLKEITSPSILHIATHGFFIANRNKQVPHPLFRSGIVLSGVNTALKGQLLPDEYEDGVFSAYDATTVNLKDTEIVVLSACETGLGEIKNGEGILGLRRSFAQAGAKTVIMSLWRVSDEHTKILMERFYLSLLDGKNLAIALRDAQLALIEFLSDTFGFASPALWASFICQGDITPVDTYLLQ